MAVRTNYYYRQYYRDKKRRKQKIIVYIVAATIVAGVGCSTIRQVLKPKTIPPNNASKQQQKADQNISNLYIQAQELKSTMQQQNATVVLSGTKEVSYIFSNDKGELNSRGNPIGFLKKSIECFTSKKLTYTTTYNYLSVYDNSNINTKVEGDKLYITLSENALTIKGISEDKTKTNIETDIGIVKKNFTPQQVHAMSKYVGFEVYNSLINNQDIKKESIENMRQNIIDMCRKLGVKNFQVNIISNNTLEYESNKLTVK